MCVHTIHMLYNHGGTSTPACLWGHTVHTASVIEGSTRHMICQHTCTCCWLHCNHCCCIGIVLRLNTSKLILKQGMHTLQETSDDCNAPHVAGHTYCPTWGNDKNTASLASMRERVPAGKPSHNTGIPIAHTPRVATYGVCHQTCP